MELLNSLLDLLLALYFVLVALVRTIAPWTPLIAWVAFWTLAVDWHKLYRVLVPGFGWIGLLLIMFAAILAWGTVAPPEAGYHQILWLNVGNYVGKTVYVFGLVAIMALCGSVQLSGCCSSLCQFDEPAADDHATLH